MKKRIISLALGLIMALSLLPMAAMAYYATGSELYEALEYVRIHKDELEVSNDTTNEELAQKVLELLKPLTPDGMELTATCDIQWGLGGGYRATTEKEGNMVVHIILRSGGSQNDWTIQITIPKVAVNQSDVEKLEEDAKAIAEAWADYFDGVIITEDNITRRSGPLEEAAKAAVKNGSEVKWVPGSFSTWFEKHYIRGTLQMILNGHKKELELDVTINDDGSTTINKPVVESPTPSTPSTPSIPATGTAYASPWTVDIDGKQVEFQMYALKNANGGLNNYIKVRDLAAVLDGTAAQFNVGWDGSVNLETGVPYTTRNGTENKSSFSGDRTYVLSTSSTNVNSAASDLVGIYLTDDTGGGHNYYQLRDLGRKLGFNVGWSAERGIFLETDKPYTDDD